jgi:hypothetical protein
MLLAFPTSITVLTLLALISSLMGLGPRSMRWLLSDSNTTSVRNSKDINNAINVSNVASVGTQLVRYFREMSTEVSGVSSK